MCRGDDLGAVCIMNLWSFLAMKGSKGSSSPLGLGCAGLCRRRCGGRAGRRGMAGGRAAGEGAGQLVLEAVTPRGTPHHEELEAGAPGSQHKLHHFWGLLQTQGRGYSFHFLWSHGV